jgi:hypothetical protein
MDDHLSTSFGGENALCGFWSGIRCKNQQKMFYETILRTSASGTLVTARRTTNKASK